MTQDDVAEHLEVSRSTIAQMELGNRAVTSLELDRLAYLYGREIRHFLAEECRGEGAIVTLFRRHPEVADQEAVRAALRQCVALGQEITNLERLLDLDRDVAVAAYSLPTPKSKWNAIQQGERIATEERRRLGLGNAPLPNIVELLETQGVRTAQASLPNDISGLTVVESDTGILVVANRDHHIRRRRFSYTHEYCHALLDRGQGGTISYGRARNDLLEVRANAFAASFLMPDDGVLQFVHGLAKGHPSRQRVEVFDEEVALRAEGRSAPGSQDIQIYDVVLLAHHFRVSRLSAIFRLRNLRLITQAELTHLREQDERGVGKALAHFLDLPQPDHEAARNELRHRFLGLALEAFRRELISRRKLEELATMVEVPRGELTEVLAEMGLDDADEPVDVMLPGT